MPVEIMVLQMQRYQKYFRKMSMYNDVFFCGSTTTGMLIGGKATIGTI